MDLWQQLAGAREQDPVEPAIKQIREELSKRNRSFVTDVHCLASDSEHLVVGGVGTITVLDYATLEVVKTYQGHLSEVTGLAYHKGYLYSGSNDNTLACWDLAKGRCVERVQAHTARIESILVSPDTRELVSASQDGTIKFRSLVRLTFTRELQGARATELLCLTEGGFLVASCADNKLIAWDIKDLTPKLDCSGTSVCSLCSIDDRTRFVAGTESGAIAIWSIYNSRTESVLKAHTSPVRKLQCTSDKEYLVSADDSALVMVWTLETKLPLCQLRVDAAPTDLHLSSNDKYLALALGTRLLSIYDFQENHLTAQFMGKTAKIERIQSNSRGWVVTTGKKETIFMWDASNRIYTGMIKFQTLGIGTFALHPSEQTLLFATADHMVKLWNLDRGFVELDCVQHQAAVVCIEWLTARKFFSVSTDGTLIMYDLAQRASTFTTLIGGSHLFVLSPDKELLAFTQPELVQLYSLRRRRPGQSFAISREVTSLCFDPDRSQYIFGSAEGAIEVWINERREFELLGHTLKVTSLRMNGRNLFSASFDQTIKLWDVAHRMLYGTISLEGKVRCLHIADDAWIYAGVGNQLVSILNPFQSAALVCVGPSRFSFTYLVYLQQLVQAHEDVSEFHSELLDWVVLPHALNLLHVFCFFGNKALTKQALIEGSNFLRTQTGLTPISVSVARHSIDCLEVLAKYLGENIQKNPLCSYSVEDDIVLLNRASPMNLAYFYEALFQKPKQLDLPGYGHFKESPPVVALSHTQVIQPAQFVSEVAESRVEFKSTSFRMNFLMGSAESVEFLRSLMETNNGDVLRTAFVQHYLSYKWNTAKKLIWVKGVMHILLTLALISCWFVQDEVGPLYVLLGISTCSLLIQLIQLVLSFRSYFSAMWNVIDCVQLILIYYYLMQQFSLVTMRESRMQMAGLLVVVWTRGLAYLRVFDNARYMIRMLVEVVKDMFSFTVILVYTAVGFVLVYISLTNQDLEPSLIHMYKLLFGDFNTDQYTLTSEWVWFFFGSVVNPLVLLNMLIALMGDTYDRVQESQDITDLRELTDVILECENLLFWRRNQGIKQHFQIATEFTSAKDNDRGWQGRIQSIKAQVSGIVKVQAKVEKNLAARIDSITGRLGELVESTQSKLESIDRTAQFYNARRKHLRPQ